MVSGTRNHVSPFFQRPAVSVRSMPAAKAAKAPAVQVCESDPTTIMPGRAYSPISWWQMPSPAS